MKKPSKDQTDFQKKLSDMVEKFVDSRPDDVHPEDLIRPLLWQAVAVMEVVECKQCQAVMFMKAVTLFMDKRLKVGVRPHYDDDEADDAHQVRH